MKSRKYQIYQLNADLESVRRNHKMFASWEEVKDEFTLKEYKKIYDSEMNLDDSDLDALEKIFQIFNVDHPDDFRGHSLSVSDVVILDGVKYYCDNYGWEKIRH